MSDERFRRLPHPHPYNNGGPGSGRPSKRPRDPMSMARLNNATGSSSAGPSLILPTRHTHYNSNSNNNNNNMGLRPSLPPPNRSSSSAQTVIDLTDSPPPQENVFDPTNHDPSRAANSPSRGGSSRAEVIDVDALPDSPALPPRRGYHGWNLPIGDAEALFDRPIASRMLGGGPHMASRAHPHHPQHGHGWIPRRPMPVEPSVLYNRVPDRSAERNPQFQPQFHQELDDPILGGRVRQAIPDLHGVGGPRNIPYGGGGGGGAVGGARALSMMMPEDMMQHFIQSLPPARQWQGELFNFQAPGQLDYRQRTQGIIREEPPVVDAARARNIDYKAPPPARPGFTRSPKENDFLVCASCSSELGVEGDGPAANEVWAAKCGHCYCGTCVSVFRSIPPAKSAGGRRPTRPKTKNCVVGCKMNLGARTTMFKIHL